MRSSKSKTATSRPSCRARTAEIRSSLYRPLHKFFFWLLVADYIMLGYLGQQIPESPFIEIGQVASIYYFAYFLVIVPVLGRFEQKLRFI